MDVVESGGFARLQCKTSVLVGPTPAFAHAGLRAEIKDELSPQEGRAWLSASLALARRLETGHAVLGAALRMAEAAPADEARHPLAIWWHAFMAGAGAAGEAFDSRRQDDVTLIHTACPYEQFRGRALLAAQELLGAAHMAWRRGRLEVNAAALRTWLNAVAALPRFLPAPDVLALHARLSEAGVMWQWLGAGKTRVGEGVRQQVLDGAGVDQALAHPEALRIPIYTVTGSVGKTTTVRLLSQLLRGTGRCLAVAASDGAWIGGKLVIEGDAIGGITALGLLRSPETEAAVFEQGRGGILNQGVPYPRSDVAVLLNVQAVHLGLRGIDTLEQMADVKAFGLAPARVVLLNADDAQCRRLATQFPPERRAWFSVTAAPEELLALGHSCRGALGVLRDPRGAPAELVMVCSGSPAARLSLEGVAPYHGLLGEKTLEELLAAVGAAWLGPLPLADMQGALRQLRLDSTNHAFRTSVHRSGPFVFVLDKAAEEASLAVLETAVRQLCSKEGIRHTIAVLCRSAGEVPERHLESARVLHRFVDEFVCFDRADSYTTANALPIYRPGSIPLLLRDEILRLNAELGIHKPVTVAADWDSAEEWLARRAAATTERTLVLVNQPATAASCRPLNQRILAFANGAAPQLEAQRHL